MKTRQEVIERIAGRRFDVCIIGGGATGCGCALDARLRGLDTVLLEANDFASGSSTASTKLVHGGVRYLQEAVQGLDVDQYHLVEQALRERAVMLRNAPHLTRAVEFLVPCFSQFDRIYYGLGMKMYDWIAGQASLQPSRVLNRQEALGRMPPLQGANLAGAVSYADGQFDDARYALALLQTFVEADGEALNYARVTAFGKDSAGKLESVSLVDGHSTNVIAVRARAFVNATGPFSDAVRRQASGRTVPRMRPSKGAHVLFPLGPFPPDDALLIPKTDDGRVVFAIPWNGRLLVGTTDTGYRPDEEMAVTKVEIEYLLRQLNPYLARPLTPDEAVAGFAGVRPLVAAPGVAETRKLVRDDEVEFDEASGLVSILGGKWTTYRSMAEETVDRIEESLGRTKQPARTREHPLAGSNGYHQDYWRTLEADFRIPAITAQHLARKYGTLSPQVLELTGSEPALARPLVEGEAPIGAQVVYAARREMALTVEDVLARRIGLQFYGWRTAVQAAPAVAALLGRELGWSDGQEKLALAEYVERINRMLALAGLPPEPFPSARRNVVFERN